MKSGDLDEPDDPDRDYCALVHAAAAGNLPPREHATGIINRAGRSMDDFNLDLKLVAMC